MISRSDWTTETHRKYRRWMRKVCATVLPAGEGGVRGGENIEYRRQPRLSRRPLINREQHGGGEGMRVTEANCLSAVS